MREETFGPVCSFIGYRSEEEALARMNASPYGPAASVWSDNIRQALRYSEAIEAGIVWVNMHTFLDPAVPFGGMKGSGIGREFGSAFIDDYTELKSVMVRPDASSRFTEPTHSTYRPWRRDWHRPVSRHWSRDPDGRSGGLTGLRRRRDCRFSDHAPAGRNGGGRASIRFLAHFAQILGPFAGFLSGWNYWVMFVLVGMAELTAAGIYMQYWLPDVPTWVWAAAFFIIINAVNSSTYACMAKRSSGLR